MPEVCGDKGDKLLQAALKDTLPAPGKPKDLTQTLQLLTLLAKKPVFKLAQREKQRKVGVLQKMIGVMREGRALNIAEVSSDNRSGTQLRRRDSDGQGGDED